MAAEAIHLLTSEGKLTSASFEDSPRKSVHAKKSLGRPIRLDTDKLDLARRLIGEGQGKAEAARMIGVDPVHCDGGSNDRFQSAALAATWAI